MLEGQYSKFNARQNDTIYCFCIIAAVFITIPSNQHNCLEHLDTNSYIDDFKTKSTSFY